MLFSIGLLIVIFYLAYRAAPREREEDKHIHGAGQIGLLAAVALFGVDYFTSFYYGTGELMSALHPYGLQHLAYYSVALIAVANFIFGALYMYSLGIFNEGGGSYTASMRYLKPTLSLIVAVTLIQDYVLTIVVSALSGGDQLLSILGAYGTNWIWHFAIGASLAAITWYLTIRGRGESARVVFILLGVFVMLTLGMAIGLFIAHFKGVPSIVATEVLKPASIGQALYHLLTATMKGMVALSGLEAMSNGIQFVKDEDTSLVKWGKERLPKLKGLWSFYSGKSGIGRFVQTSFLFYGGLTTLFLVMFSLRFNVFDGTLGRTLVGNLAYIGFNQLPGGNILFWVYQFLAVALLAAASMTAFQDAQATEWRDVAIGEIPEAIVVMGLAVRKHVLENYTGRVRRWGSFGAGVAAALAALIFVGQIAGKWTEGGWVVLISFSLLALAAHLLLLSPLGFREPTQIHRIVRDKARVKGAMASIVEWQSLKMQEYRYSLLMSASRASTKFFALFGVYLPTRYYPVPAPAGDYDHALHVDHPDAPSLLAQYMPPEEEELRLGEEPEHTETPKEPKGQEPSVEEELEHIETPREPEDTEPGMGQGPEQPETPEEEE
jgi:hypothetical protein